MKSGPGALPRTATLSPAPHSPLHALRSLPRRKASALGVRAALLALGLAAALPAGIQSALAADAAAVAAYDIPAGPLDVALARFGQASGALLSFPPELAAGRRSPGVSGRHSAPEALARLLAGTGLEAVPQANGGYTLRALPAAPGPTTLQPVKVTAQAEASATTEGSGSYAASGATLFKGSQALKDIPQSITVVTRQRMDDQRLDTLDEVLAHTTGVTLVKRPGGGSDIYSRGFMTNTLQYDGVPLQRASTWGNAFAGSSVYLDRVEVMRGAQGLLEGAGNPAGSVNLVRKRGMAERALNVEGRVGSWDNYGTRLEAGGPLNEAGTLRSRVVLDYEDRDYFVDTIHERNLNAYAALDLDLTPDTTVGIGLVHSVVKGNKSLYDGLPRYANGRAIDLPRSTYIGASWNDAERRETQALLDLEHRLAPDWKLKVAGAYIEESWDATQSVFNGLVAVGGNTVNGTGYIYDYRARNFGLDAHLSGTFKAFGMAHELVVGGNYSEHERDDGYTQYWSYTTYNVFNINRDALRFDGLTPSAIVGSNTNIRQHGFYGMLRSHLTDKLTLVLGSRASWYTYAYENWYASTFERTTMKENGRLTPYAGIVYALTPQWSAYASYADIFQPQSETDIQHRTLDPIIGVNYEAGIKGELFDGKLNTSLALFRIEQENRAVTDYDSPAICGATADAYCARQAGKVRSEGFELEASGQPMPNWQLSAGYTYSRNEYLKDTVATNVGRPFDYNTPRHMLRVWSDWQLTGELSKWRAGLGVDYRSEQRTASNTLLNPVQGAYAIWNARLGYQIDKTWSASLNIQNLFDRHYYSFIRSNYFATHVGEPRNFLLTVRGKF